MHKIPYIDIHTHHTCKADGVLSILNCFPDDNAFDYCKDRRISIGLHPWYLKKADADSGIELIKTMASYKNVLAIGEIGLDRTIDTSFKVQKEYFLKQIEIAHNHNKPVIIHCVKYFPELISLKKKVKSKTPWLIHGFRNNRQIAADLLKQDCYLSFGEALLIDKNNQDVFIEMPLNRVFLETDERKSSIIEIYNKAAHLKGLKLNDLKEILFNNYRTVFNPK